MSGYCKECVNQPCICDVLDSITPVINNALKAVQDAIIASQPCDHIYGLDADGYDNGNKDIWEYFKYCPRCGKKLNG